MTYLTRVTLEIGNKFSRNAVNDVIKLHALSVQAN